MKRKNDIISKKLRLNSTEKINFQKYSKKFNLYHTSKKVTEKNLINLSLKKNKKNKKNNSNNFSQRKYFQNKCSFTKNSNFIKDSIYKKKDYKKITKKKNINNQKNLLYKKVMYKKRKSLPKNNIKKTKISKKNNMNKKIRSEIREKSKISIKRKISEIRKKSKILMKRKISEITNKSKFKTKNSKILLKKNNFTKIKNNLKNLNSIDFYKSSSSSEKNDEELENRMKIINSRKEIYDYKIKLTVFSCRESRKNIFEKKNKNSENNFSVKKLENLVDDKKIEKKDFENNLKNKIKELNFDSKKYRKKILKKNKATDFNLLKINIKEEEENNNILKIEKKKILEKISQNKNIIIKNEKDSEINSDEFTTKNTKKRKKEKKNMFLDFSLLNYRSDKFHKKEKHKNIKINKTSLSLNSNCLLKEKMSLKKNQILIKRKNLNSFQNLNKVRFENKNENHIFDLKIKNLSNKNLQKINELKKKLENIDKNWKNYNLIKEDELSEKIRLDFQKKSFREEKKILSEIKKKIFFNFEMVDILNKKKNLEKEYDCLMKKIDEVSELCIFLKKNISRKNKEKKLFLENFENKKEKNYLFKLEKEINENDKILINSENTYKNLMLKKIEIKREILKLEKKKNNLKIENNLFSSNLINDYDHTLLSSKEILEYKIKNLQKNFIKKKKIIENLNSVKKILIINFKKKKKNLISISLDILINIKIENSLLKTKIKILEKEKNFVNNQNFEKNEKKFEKEELIKEKINYNSMIIENIHNLQNCAKNWDFICLFQKLIFLIRKIISVEYSLYSENYHNKDNLLSDYENKTFKKLFFYDKTIIKNQNF